jgi:hypothetical protein
MITQGQLRDYARLWQGQSARSASEARSRGLKTAFICHSHQDRDLVLGLVAVLHRAGWVVYVDWLDATLPDRPNRETARRIKDRIRDANYFLFLATAASCTSRWCPWEIGYADGVKPIEAIMIIPTQDSRGYTHGNEYLDLYRRIDHAANGDIAAWGPGETSGVYVRNL